MMGGVSGLANSGVKFGVRFLFVRGDEVVLKSESAPAYAAMMALVVRGRATVDGSGHFLIKAGDPVASKLLGNWGEQRLAQDLGIEFRSAVQRYEVILPDGRTTFREIDALKDGIAYEAKAGVDATLTTAIKQQIDGDLYLLSQKRFEGIRWNFYQGADPKLLEYLASKGIPYEVKQ